MWSRWDKKTQLFHQDDSLSHHDNFWQITSNKSHHDKRKSCPAEIKYCLDEIKIVWTRSFHILGWKSAHWPWLGPQWASTDPGPSFNINIIFLGINIFIIKIRQSLYHLYKSLMTLGHGYIITWHRKIWSMIIFHVIIHASEVKAWMSNHIPSENIGHNYLSIS